MIINEVTKDFLESHVKEHPGIAYSIEGESKQSAISISSMIQASTIGIIGIFVLLSFQFRSYFEPIIVMTAVPFALIGVIWGHLIMQHDISMPSMLGFASLAGVVVNDSILLVLFVKISRDKGLDILDSCAQASRQRFRAIMITSLTTIAGLLPLMAEQSLQAQVLIPLAISIIFGLLASTVLVLLVVPCLYVILADFRMISGKDEEHDNEH